MIVITARWAAGEEGKRGGRTAAGCGKEEERAEGRAALKPAHAARGGIKHAAVQSPHMAAQPRWSPRRGGRARARQRGTNAIDVVPAPLPWRESCQRARTARVEDSEVKGRKGGTYINILAAE